MVTRKKDLIIRRVLEFYFDSSDFNGIPHWQLHAEVGGDIQDVNALLEELLNERKITINFSANPHFRNSKDESHHAQLLALQNWRLSNIYIYPSQMILDEMEDDEYQDQYISRIIRSRKAQEE